MSWAFLLSLDTNKIIVQYPHITMAKYIVYNQVTERISPKLTAFGGKIIAEGQTVDISDIIVMDNETWGRIAHRDRTYVAISIGDKDFLVPIQPIPDPIIFEKLVIWARIQGFKP
jgi:hypothetical protein